MKHKFL